MLKNFNYLIVYTVRTRYIYNFCLNRFFVSIKIFKLILPDKMDCTDIFKSCTILFSFFIDTAKSLGHGVYFDSSLTRCLEETHPQGEGTQRVVYLCRVLTGVFTQGSPNLVVPPEKSGGSRHSCYDSVVDDVSNPQTFVIFRDSQAYPEYMIKLPRDLM